MAGLREHLATNRQMTLKLALDSTWNRRASDPKDKIIGLLGLVQNPGLKPTYLWTREKIYRLAFRHALQEDGGLACLGFMSESAGTRNPNLPSWVPDFEVHSEPESDYITSLSKPLFTEPLYNASLMKPGTKASMATEGTTRSWCSRELWSILSRALAGRLRDGSWSLSSRSATRAGGMR